jgi:hypothetical protein
MILNKIQSHPPNPKPNSDFAISLFRHFAISLSPAKDIISCSKVSYYKQNIIPPSKMRIRLKEINNYLTSRLFRNFAISQFRYFPFCDLLNN